MAWHLPIVPVLVEERLLDLDARGALAGKRACPVDLKALPTDRTADITIALGGLTKNLHRRFLHPAGRNPTTAAGWNSTAGAPAD
jgi:hypothetical protein